MSEHDDAGSAVTFPPLLPPPPPHPAARSARTAAEPISAASESLLLTLPPQSPTGRVHRGPRPAAGASIGPFHRPFQPASAATVAGTTPKWRNWQTRRTQNPVPFGECGFDSHLRHSGRVAFSRGRGRTHLGSTRSRQGDRGDCSPNASMEVA